MRGWALLALAAVAGRPASAQRSFVIQRFESTIRIEPNGDLEIAESITPRFTGSWNGIIRSIPVEYRTPQGFNWTLGLSLESVTGENDHALKVETSRKGHYVNYKIWVPDAQDAARTFVLHYRARNGLRFFEDHDELYWNVTGDEWTVPIEAASAVIELPPRAEGLRAIAFNGVYGSTARDAAVEIGDRSVRVTMPHRLAFHEGLTAVVGWNKGAVREPTAADRAAAFLRSNWPLTIPIVVFAGSFLLWWRRGKDPRRRPIAVQYDPPDGFTPAEVGTLIDNSADLRDITATMVDLAVRGFIRFEEKEEPRLLGLLSGREYVLHRVKPSAEWAGLAVHEQKVLYGIFDDGTGSVKKLSDLEQEFYTRLPGIRSGIFDRLQQRGVYRARPDQVMNRWHGGGLLFGAVVVLGGMKVAPLFSLAPAPFVVAGVLSGLILAGFGAIMPARTESGTRVLEKVLGFDEFLRRVETEHFEHVVRTPELFDRLLPFAMALGVERKWARAFQGIYTQPPSWYVGTGPGFTQFDLGHFSSRLSDFSGKVGSTISSQPRTSSGSGFGGGGSSGGGGGGGGGSGF